MRNHFTLERHALERHQTYLREAAHDRLLPQRGWPIAQRVALAGLAVLTLVFASTAWTYLMQIYSATAVA